ncbi:glycosyltransferase [Salinisphaera orenii]|uniref:glycosyltransferase n=1 Tax=Salinisphaera orenii TaxID=856731 RepID=UPI0019550ADA
MNRQHSGVIAYDFLFCRGGAEEVTLALARGLEGLDVCVGFRDLVVFPDEALGGIRVRPLGRPPSLAFRAWRTLSGLHAFRHRAGFLADYDWAVFSGSNAPVAVHHRPAGRNLYYCHTLPRFAYDLFDWYLAALPAWQRPAFRLLARYVRREYERALGRMDRVIANSANVQDRLWRYLGIDAEVVHPPVDTAGFRWREQGGYFLSTARLEPYKRVDRIIEAFRCMPERELVVASGGSDEPRLRRLAAGAANIRFAGWQSDEGLRELVGNALATVYVAKDEDFGMSPVESMAAGKPVVAAAEGGLLETVVDGETGVLVPADPAPEDLIVAVERLTPEVALGTRPVCENRAEAFGVDRFVHRMRELIEATGRVPVYGE